MRSSDSLATLSERQLLHRFGDLIRQDRRCTAQLLAAIAEIDERKLWAKHACPSMFAFCVERFHMSESQSAKRIWAARTARRFPLILKMVAGGELHLTAIVKLAKHLTEDNHRALLARAKNKSSREIDLLVAEVAPQPDAPSRVRALPNRAGSAVHSQPVSASAGGGPELAAASCSPAASSAPIRHNQVVPLAPRRYKIEITVGQQTHDDLRKLEELLSHEFPAADPAVIVSRAIDRLLADTLKKKAALTDRPRPGDQSRARPGTRRTRAIPAAIRREVSQRDGGRCGFIDERGRRCRATRRVEYHHHTPYVRGGQHEARNIALRCRAHNQYQADLDFGRNFMRERRGGDNPHSARNAGAPFAAPSRTGRPHRIDRRPGNKGRAER